MKTSLIAAVSLCAGLSGCATMEPQPTGPEPCNTAVCFVSVTVQDCVASVSNPELHVIHGNNHATIRFQLDRSSVYRYAFTVDGIAFKNDPGGQMRPMGRSLLGDTYTIIDINDAPGRYEYRVGITRRVGADCPTVDPFIINN